jgi:hypothetical protein
VTPSERNLAPLSFSINQPCDSQAVVVGKSLYLGAGAAGVLLVGRRPEIYSCEMVHFSRSQKEGRGFASAVGVRSIKVFPLYASAALTCSRLYGARNPLARNFLRSSRASSP